MGNFGIRDFIEQDRLWGVVGRGETQFDDAAETVISLVVIRRAVLIEIVGYKLFVVVGKGDALGVFREIGD